MRSIRYWLNKLNLHRKFRKRLGAAIATTILVFSLLLAWVVGDISQAQLRADSGKILAQLAYHFAGDLDRGVYVYFQEIQTLASLEEMRTTDQPVDAKRVLLERLQRAYSDFAWIGLADAEGKVIASTQGILEGKDVSERPWFVEGRNQPTVQNVHAAELLASLVPHPSGNQERFAFSMSLLLL